MDEDVVGKATVGVALSFGGKVFVLGFVNHGAGHLDEVDECRELYGAQVAKAVDGVFEVVFGCGCVNGRDVDGIDCLQYFGAEEMTA